MNSAYLSKLCRTSSSSRTCRVVVFGCFDGAFRSAKRFPPFGIRDALRPALQTVCSDSCTRPKHGPELLGAGGGGAHEILAGERRPIRGRFPPSYGFCHVHISPSSIPRSPLSEAIGLVCKTYREV